MNDSDIVGMALFRGIINLNEVKEEFKKDINIVRYALKYDGFALRYADPKFRDNTELIKLIVTYKLDVLYYASDNIKNSKELFLDCIERDPEIACYLGSELQSDRNFLYLLIDKNYKAYDYLPSSLKNDKSFALDILTKSIITYHDMTEALQCDLEILLTFSYYAGGQTRNPFNHQYVIKTAESSYIYEHSRAISESTFPILKEALLKNSADVISPPESIKILISGSDDPFLLLAHYALRNEHSIDHEVSLPEDLLY